MFNLGAPEIMVILVVALIVLGPKRLPQAGRQLGRALAEFRRVTTDVKADLQEALAVDELRDAFGVENLRSELGVDSLRQSFDLRSALNDAGTAEKPLSRGGPQEHPLVESGAGYRLDVPAPDGLSVSEPAEAGTGVRTSVVDVPPPPELDGPDPLQGTYQRAAPPASC